MDSSFLIFKFRVFSTFKSGRHTAIKKPERGLITAGRLLLRRHLLCLLHLLLGQGGRGGEGAQAARSAWSAPPRSPSRSGTEGGLAAGAPSSLSPPSSAPSHLDPGPTADYFSPTCACARAPGNQCWLRPGMESSPCCQEWTPCGHGAAMDHHGAASMP